MELVERMKYLGTRLEAGLRLPSARRPASAGSHGPFWLSEQTPDRRAS